MFNETLINRGRMRTKTNKLNENINDIKDFDADGRAEQIRTADFHHVKVTL